MPQCRECGEELSDANWYPSFREHNNCICIDCDKLRSKEFRWQLKIETIEAYGGECECCHEKHIEFLTIDHIHDDGKIERMRLFGDPQRGGGDHFYAWLKRQGYPQENYQCLCWNCQWAKYRYGYCPHKKDTPERRGEYRSDSPPPDLPFRIEL